MTIQIALIFISILLLVILVLLVWVIRLTIKRKAIIRKATTASPNLALKKQVFYSPKYAKSKLKEAEKETYLNELVTHLALYKTYRQPDLSIAQLAQQVKIPKHHLSQIINEKMECSFLDFINQYRVEEAKEKLRATDFQDLSILAIGITVGFKAKSTFYAAFKKFTNCTPGDYRKKKKKKEASFKT